MPLTRDGLLTALESLLDQPITIRVHTNEPDGDVVSISDLEEARNSKPVTLTRKDWQINEEAVHATGPRTAIRFSGRAGKVTGWHGEARGRVVVYEQFMDPVPVNTDEDIIWVTPRIRAESLVT